MSPQGLLELWEVLTLLSLDVLCQQLPEFLQPWHIISISSRHALKLLEQYFGLEWG